MATAPPPSMDLRRLDDPSRYECVPGVPVFQPHVRRDPATGKVKYTVTAADLPEIAANMQRLENDRAVVGRITEGHVFPEVAEKDQPKPVGYVRFKSARVGTWQGTPAILADLYYRRDKAADAKAYPYRSAEYYPGAKVIRGLALLVRDPALDMGTVIYSAAGERPEFYSMEATMPTPGEAGAVPGATNATPPGGGAAKYTPEEVQQYEKCRSYMRETYALEEGWPGAAKAPANDATPPPKDGPPADKSDPKEDLQRKEAPELYAKVARLEQTLAAERLARDTEVCVGLVTGLKAEGYSLTSAEQADLLAELKPRDKAGREKFLTLARKAYTRVPTGRLELYQGSVEGGGADENDPFAAPWYHEAAEHYMLERPGTTYEAAVNHVKATAKR